MYSISASRGPPEFVKKRKSVSKEMVQDIVAKSSSDLAIKKEFIITPFKHHSAVLPPARHNSENSNMNKVPSDDFWGRKGVIKMDPSDEDRCSHTTIPPSAMMTLAMELHVSNRGKASKMFREGRQKSQSSEYSGNSSDTTEETNLINMWVVPEQGGSSRNNTPSTASHLQPSLANADFVINRTSAANTPSPEIPQCETKLEEEDAAFFESITAADLVGSPDQTMTHNDPDFQNEKFSPRNLSPSKNNVEKSNENNAILDDNNLRTTFENKKMEPNSKKENCKTTSKPLPPCDCHNTVDDCGRQTHKLKQGHSNSVISNENFKKTKRYFIPEPIETNAITRSTLMECHKPLLTDRSDIKHDDPSSSSHLQRSNCNSVSPEFDSSPNAQQINVENHALDNLNDAYKELDCNNDETISSTNGCCSGHKLLTKDNETSNKATDLKALNGFGQSITNYEKRLGNRSANDSLKQVRTTSEAPYCNEEFSHAAHNGIAVSPVENEIDCCFTKENMSCHEAKEDVCRSESTDINQTTFQTSLRVNRAQEISMSDSSISGFRVCDLPLAANRSLSSSSLVSLSSLDSMSSASIQLSSYASGKASAASCVSMTSDLQDHNSKCQGSFSSNEFSFNEREARWHLNNDLTEFSTSFAVATSGKDPANQYQSSINRNCSTKVNKHSALQPRARSENQVATDSSRSLFENSDTHRPLRGGAGRCYSSLELRRPRSVSPSRKVICQYVSQDSTLDRKDDRKSPSGLIISRAVFPDEKDSTVATPILHLKNKNRICSKCRKKMAFCCCAPKRSNSSKSSHRGSKDRLRKFGDYSTIDKYVVVSSGPTQLNRDANDSAEHGKEAVPITQASKPPISATRTKEKNDRASDNATVAKQGFNSVTESVAKPSHTQVKAIVEPEVKVITTPNKEKCRITLSAIKQSSNNRDMNYHRSNISENKTMDNKLHHSRQFSSSKMEKTPVSVNQSNSAAVKDNWATRQAKCNVWGHVQEDAVTAKLVANENAGFGGSRFQNESKSKIDVVNPNPRVNVVNGSRIALKKISTDSTTSNMHFSNRDRNSFDKAESGEEVVLKDNTPLLSAAPLHEKHISFEHQQATTATASQSPDSAVYDNRFTADKNSYQSEGWISPTRSSMQPAISSLPSSTSIKLVKSGPSSQGLPHVVVRQKSVEPDRLNGQRQMSLKRQTEIKDKPCQKSPASVHASIVTESQVKVFQLKTPIKSSTTSEIFIPRTSSTSDKGRNSSSQASTCQSSIMQANEVTTTQKQAPSKKPIYSSSVSLSLHPLRKSSVDNSALSARDAIVSSSPVRPKPTDKVAGVVGEGKRTQYRKWVHNWSSPAHASDATSSISVDGCERHDAMTSPLRQSPSPQQAGNASARPPTASPVRQANRIVAQGRGSARGSNVQRSNGCEMEMKQGTDGSRSPFQRSTSEGKGVREAKIANNSDCLRESPPHALEDEEDFSGVVDGPMMTVKEIRAKYKGRDYENYGKPRSVSSSSNNTSRKGSEDGTRRSMTDFDLQGECAKEPKNVVAQQVMNLFKGALDVEKELAVFEEETRRIETSQNKPQMYPVKRNGPVITIIERTCREEPERESLVSCTKTSRTLVKETWPPVHQDGMEKKDVRSSVEEIKTESKEVASFDESLDEFYDVFNDLTS